MFLLPHFDHDVFTHDMLYTYWTPLVMIGSPTHRHEVQTTNLHPKLTDCIIHVQSLPRL